VEAKDAIHEGTCSGFREEAWSSDPNVHVPFVV
jgi:hypothetical protein